MSGEPMDDDAQQAVEAFIAEVRHWREVAGLAQKALARLVGYSSSYVSKVEKGSIIASREFAENADRATRAGRAIVRRWRDMNALIGDTVAVGHHEEPPQDDPQSAAGTALIVEHEDAALIYNEGVFETRIRRQLHNVGTEPVSRYLIRVAVDRYPGDPERSNRLYREHPLTWEEIRLRPPAVGELQAAWPAVSFSAMLCENC